MYILDGDNNGEDTCSSILLYFINTVAEKLKLEKMCMTLYMVWGPSTRFISLYCPLDDHDT